MLHLDLQNGNLKASKGAVHEALWAFLLALHSADLREKERRTHKKYSSRSVQQCIQIDAVIFRDNELIIIIIGYKNYSEKIEKSTPQPSP